MNATLAVALSVGLTLAVAPQLPRGSSSGTVAPPSGDTLSAFVSEAEFQAFLRRHVPPRPIFRREAVMDGAVVLEAAAPAVGVTSMAPSITNVQHAGVDEGGIVKLHGDHLVILRRGRLFTVAVGDDALAPVSMVDAFGPDIDPAGTWYDELIIHGNVVAVVGYSYARGGTEVGLFSIDPAGNLRHRSTYQLRSNDYYSSRNYASRLVDGKLVFYAPVPIRTLGSDPTSGLPGFRRWRAGDGGTDFRRILPATRVYHAELPLERSPDLVLHTVTTCDLERTELACDASAVAGPAGRVFYVSPGSVYVWTTGWRAGGAAASSMLYRMPLDGSAPAAVRVSGSPVDQFSFLEDARGDLHVLVRSEGAGDGMWRAEAVGGEIALLRLPRHSFSDGSGTAESSWYRALPAPSNRTFRNRFVGGHLLYGSGSGWWGPQGSKGGTLFVVPLTGEAASALSIPHGVDRIEVMGRDAVVVGSDGEDLHFTSVGLRDRPEVVDRYVSAGMSQGELRSHGFFYRMDGDDRGVLGLPVRTSGRSGGAHLHEGSAGVLFLSAERSRFRPLGQLDAGEASHLSDGCRASCVDWYGNARPLFLGDRVLALLGYEIVEGQVRRDGIREVRRVDFAPDGARLSRRNGP